MRFELELEPLSEATGNPDRLLLEAALDRGVSLRVAKNTFYDHPILACRNTAKVSFPRHHVLLETRRAPRFRSGVIGWIPRALRRSRGFEASNKPNAELPPTLWRVLDDSEQVSTAAEPATEIREDKSYKADQKEP